MTVLRRRSHKNQVQTVLPMSHHDQSQTSGPVAIDDPPDFMHCMVNLCMRASSPEDARNSRIRFVGCRLGLLLLPRQGGTQQGQCLACKDGPP